MSLLELEGVCKRYRGASEEVCAADRVSMRLHEGELVALHGPSGSGKTTLLLMIAALLSPDAGEIRFKGRALAALTQAQTCDYLRRDVGFVYQHPHLMGRTSALENAALGLVLEGMGTRAAKARARPWLDRVGLGELCDRTPEELSAGERQRVAIARALAGEPELILADEPTASLDSARSADIVALLGAFARERLGAVLLVTHDLHAAEGADRRFTLCDGKLIEGCEDRPLAAPTRLGT